MIARSGGIPRWSEKYVGRPFDARQFHCWSLVRSVLKRERGIDTPEYAELAADDVIAAATIAAECRREPWIGIAAIERCAFDVQVMRSRGTREEGHVGILVSVTHLLHVEEDGESVVVALDHPTVRGRLRDLYRHRGLL